MPKKSKANEEEEEQYEVEAVVGRRGQGKKLEYLLQWEGYTETTWTPVAQCSCDELIAEYEENNPQTPAADKDRPSRSAVKSNQKNARSSARSNKQPYKKDKTPDWDESPDEEEKDEGPKTTSMVGAAPMQSAKLIPRMTSTDRQQASKRARESSDDESEKGEDSDDDEEKKGKKTMRKKIQPKRARKANDGEEKSDGDDNMSEQSETVDEWSARTLPSTSKQRYPKVMPRSSSTKSKGGKAKQAAKRSKTAKSDSDGEQSDTEMAEEEQFEVEAIDGRRKDKDGNMEYLLKWKGYEEKTWTPVEECSCTDLIAEFEKKHPLTPAAVKVGRSGKPKNLMESDGEADESSPLVETPKRRSKTKERRSPIKRQSLNLHEDTPEQGTSRRGRRAESTGSEEGSLARRAAKSPTPDNDSDTVQISDDEDLATRRAKARSAKKKPNKAYVVDLSDDSEDTEPGATNSRSRKKTKKTSSGVIEISDSDEEEEEKRHSTPVKATRPGRKSKAASKSDDDEEEEELKKDSKKATKAGGKNKAVKSNVVIPSDNDEEEEEAMEMTTPRRTGRLSKADEDGSVTRRLSRSAKGNKSARTNVDDDEDEEMATPSRGGRNKSSRSIALNLMENDDDDDDDDEEMPSRSAKKNEKKKLPQPSSAVRLNAVLSSLLTETSNARTQQPESSSAAVQPASPVRLFNLEDLPGMMVWTEGAYVEDGYNVDVSGRSSVEKFKDREIEAVVGYVPDPTYPFLLVRLAIGQGGQGNGIAVTEIIQAVHTQLASKLLPKAYSAYINRVAQLAQAAFISATAAKSKATTQAANGKPKRKGG